MCQLVMLWQEQKKTLVENREKLSQYANRSDPHFYIFLYISFGFLLSIDFLCMRLEDYMVQGKTVQQIVEVMEERKKEVQD